jgi:hypothetical protein
LTRLERFHSAIKAAFDELHHKETPLNEGDMRKLEELGEIHLPRESR